MTLVTDQINHILNTIPDYIQKVQSETNTFTKSFKCAVKSCPNKFDKFENSARFHKFPVDKKLRKLWKLKCGLQKNEHVKDLMVCSVHFYLEDYTRNYKEEFINGNFKRELKCSAIPTLKLGPNQNKHFDVSDTDYDTDLESCQTVVQSTNNENKDCPKEYKVLKKKIHLMHGSLDYEEVKREVDLNIRLQETSKRLEAEKKLCENKINTINKLIRTARVNAFRMDKMNKAEEETLRKIFSKAQINQLLGKKAIWTNNDLATAFTIRHMGSKKCYLYMKNVLKIPLPALSCVQKWAATKNDV